MGRCVLPDPSRSKIHTRGRRALWDGALDKVRLTTGMFPKGEELRFLERCLNVYSAWFTVTPIAKS